MTSVSKSSRA